MLLFSFQEIVIMLIAAMLIDWVIGDPRWPTHPVIYIGKLIRLLENWLRKKPLESTSITNTNANANANAIEVAVEVEVYAVENKHKWKSRFQGFVLTFFTIILCWGTMWGVVWVSSWLHPWLGYAVNTWFISTTIAIKGLRDAAYLVYQHLQMCQLAEARLYVGHIVGRDTTTLSEPEIVRATVETVAENIVDAVVSPLVFALMGAAPLAMGYRAVNTLDSMVGYKNEQYLHFGWFSARLDDVLNWLPARLTGLLLVVQAIFQHNMSAARSWKSIRIFAHLHPSLNSGIPESAAAGALGIELGGRNYYKGVVSERAQMGWPLRKLEMGDIVMTIRMLIGVTILFALLLIGGLVCALQMSEGYLGHGHG